MGEETITLTQHVLGLRPYVLIEFKDGGEDEDDLRAVVSSGAGISSVRDIRAALELTLESLPDDEPEPYQESED